MIDDYRGMTVEQVEQTAGVGRKRAYRLLRESALAAADADIPTGQRDRVLATLWRFAGIRNAADLLARLHADGFSIDGHDVAKTLWSLQKTGHVRFRESRSGRGLYAIALTELGANVADAIVMAEAWPGAAPAPAEAPPEPPPAEVEPLRIDVGASDSGSHIRGWRPGPDFPEIRNALERARTSRALQQAARLLEEAGEYDMALDAMAKAELTPLQAEVVRLIEGEV